MSHQEGPPNDLELSSGSCDDTDEGVEVTVNGKPRRLPPGTSVRGLVEALRLEPGLVAVERNGQVVPRREHEQVTLATGDQLEIVTFVGGG